MGDSSLRLTSRGADRPTDISPPLMRRKTLFRVVTALVAESLQLTCPCWQWGQWCGNLY
jgi:hypothetical protein